MSASEQKPLHVQWDDEKILVAAGKSPEAVRAILAQYDQATPSVWAVYQWWSRKLIPNDWRAALIYAVLASDKIDVSDLFCLGEPKGPAARATETGA
jgi:hypothetical protein